MKDSRDTPGVEPGPRDHLVTRRLERELRRLAEEEIDEASLDGAEAPERLARHVMEELRRELSADEGPSDEQARRVNALLAGAIRDSPDADVLVPARLLRGIKGRSPLGDVLPLPPLPATPFSQSDLLVNAEGQPNVGSELRAELATANSVDLICAFVIWSGVRHLRDALAAVTARGGRVRVITTTYMGATEKRAVDELVALGADVRVAFDRAQRNSTRRPGCSSAAPGSAPRSSARRTSRIRRSSTVSNGTCACRRWMPRTSSTACG